MDHPIFKLEKVVQPKTGETLEDFEGPLDLILFLLNKNKIEIQDIPIALILDQYLAYLEQRKQMDLEVASEFVTMAAHLMYIKTRMLLSIEDEEAQSEMDALIQSLAERQRGDAYARIRKLTERMGPMSEFGRSILTRGPEPMKRLLLPRDPNDEKSVVLEIRGGVGGEEGALFAADLLRMYTMYAERRGWQLEIVSQNVTELDGVKEVCATVEGDGAWSRLKFEAGTHRVQRVPETESGGRIQTSAATVAVMPEAEETELSIDPKDLQIDTFRSSGAGGQHVNKTESAIRITHLPTGTVVECQDERSQYKNKDRAMKILRSKLYEAEQARQNAEIAATRRSQVGTGDRSGKIRTYNFPQNRVTDHRLTGDSKNFNLAAVINGDLDALIDALTLADQTRRLQEGYEKGE